MTRSSRLLPYTTVLPKPPMPIGDRPVLDIVVRQLKAHGFERITIATGYLAELIEAFFRDGESYGIPIDYYREREPLGTIATKSRQIQVSYGVLRFGDDGDPTRLTVYDEKPAIDYIASMGVYCFAPRALSFIEPGKRLDFPGQARTVSPAAIRRRIRSTTSRLK
ncbi:MAG: sugar phosphate nucleotidyltransferase [Solirubrobacteraceae bacterium]|jgi:NDP-sugar pyrophosphorylase family protein